MFKQPPETRFTSRAKCELVPEAFPSGNVIFKIKKISTSRYAFP